MISILYELREKSRLVTGCSFKKAYLLSSIVFMLALIPFVLLMIWFATLHFILAILVGVLFLIGVHIGASYYLETVDKDIQEDQDYVTLQDLLGASFVAGILYGIFLCSFDIGLALGRIIHLVSNKIDQWLKNDPPSKRR